MKIPAFYHRHRKKILALVVLFFVGAGLSWIFGGESLPEYVTATAETGDIVQMVEAVGTVISDKDLELQFAMAGVVASVFVKEGDHVRPGQRLAQLKSGSRSAIIASQVANLQSAQAALAATLEGNRPEEIAVAQAQVENRRSQLAAAISALVTAKTNQQQSESKLATLKSEATINLSGEVGTAVSTVNVHLVAGDTALSVIDDVFNNTVVQDAIIKDRPGEYQDIRLTRNTAQTALNDARTNPLELARGALTLASIVIDRGFALISTTPETPYFTPAVRETQKNKLTAQRSAIQSAIGSVNTAISSLRNASASYDTRIASEESGLANAKGDVARADADILNYETTLRTEEAQLALKKAGPRKTDIDSARARVRQAQADLARTQADFSDTVLVSPIDGIVTKVNLRLGEYTPAGAAITVLGSVPYRIEMFVSEIDVPRLLAAQSGSINLDAFPDTDYKIRVSEIGRTPTDIEGISKFKITLDFTYPHDEIRIGMTGDVTVITGERKMVLKVPGRAVIETGSGSEIVRILANEKVREQAVVTGMEGESGDVEIISGLKEGDTVILLEKQ